MKPMTAVSFALITAALFGVAPILARLGLAKVDPGLGLVVRTFAVATALLVWLLASGRLTDLASMDTRSFMFLAGEGVLASLLGHLAYFYALRAGEASQVVPVVSAFPVVAFILGVTVLGETATPGRWIGAALVVAGVVLLRS